MSFIANAIAIDYVKMTTFDKQQFEYVAYVMRQSWGGELVPFKLAQYEGYKSSESFFGAGWQGDNLHYMVWVSGTAANWFTEFLKRDELVNLRRWSFTRLDCQLTQYLPHYELVADDWVKRNIDGGGKRGAVEPRHSRAGDTIYLGSKQSSRFYRVYVKMWVKDDLEHYGQWIRVEAQMKEEAADSHRKTLIDTDWESWLRRCWADNWERMTGRRERVKGYKLAFCPRVLKAFDKPMDELAVLPERKTPDTMGWLCGIVDHTIRKVANEAENRRALTNLVRSWLDHIERIDNE